jgi:hypothetical protein
MAVAIPGLVPVAAALIQLHGPALEAGVLAGSIALPLERAQHGDTPVLTFRSPTSTGSTGGATGAATVRFLLDTGASSSLVSPALVARLNLSSRLIPPRQFALAGAGEACGALQPRRARLPLLTAGGPGAARLSLSGAEVLVLPVGGLPADVDGVLGAPQLRQLPLWVDPHGGELAFGPAALRLAAAASQGDSAAGRPVTHALLWKRGVPLMALPLAAVPGQPTARLSVPALADTGAEGLFLTPGLSARLMPVGPSRPLRVAGFCGEESARWVPLLGPHLLPRQGHGGHLPAPVQAITTTNPVFGALGVEAIVGQELLRSHRQLWRLDATPPLLRLWPGRL